MDTLIIKKRTKHTRASSLPSRTERQGCNQLTFRGGAIGPSSIELMLSFDCPFGISRSVGVKGKTIILFVYK